jgi:transposase-like protein
MPRTRKHYSADFKAKVALSAIKGQQTINEIASEFSVHPNQVSQWKKQLLDEAPQVFSSGRARADEDSATLIARLYQEIGQRTMELEWLKKKSGIER